jgi:hypothetical protein
MSDTICAQTLPARKSSEQSHQGRPSGGSSPTLRLPVFRVIALTVLLLSYAQPPMVLHDAPLRMVVALNALHTVVAVLTVWSLSRTER